MFAILNKIFGKKEGKDVKKILPLVEEINQHFASYQNLTDDELRAKTTEFKQRITESLQETENEIAALKEKLSTAPQEEHEEIYQIIENLEKETYSIIKETLDEILPEAYAVVKETCCRLVGKSWDVMGNKFVWEIVPYDEQLIGGIILHQGKIAEMATGEGKTLVATLPLYLNALAGKGVHLVTVNDYLAQRDSQWMGKIFEFHGLTVGCIIQNQDPARRRKEYASDITYGTNNEFGFDYLRDNMVGSPEDLVQRKHFYAIVDEVDSVLIDEARTPLIISGPVEVDDNKFNEMKPQVERLVNAQRNLVAKVLTDAEKNLTEGKEKEAGVFLLRAYKGDPKSNRLMKLFAEGKPKTLMLSAEGEYMAEQNKRMHEITDELYYTIDEKNHVIDLTEKGREFLAGASNKDFFLLPDIGTELSVIENNAALSSQEKQQKKDELNKLYAERSDKIHTVRQLLRAYSLYQKDDEYVVSEDGKIMIVDEFTGRLLSGRRYSDGLHQAIEAKEGVKVERDTQTLATITLQNYFRLYKKLAGMTGTAETEASEFFEIYKLEVAVIPTHKKAIRIDDEDVVYKTKREKYNAVVDEIAKLHNEQKPVLVGTTSVDVSETISRLLKRKGVPHNVLNAKQHQREAEIVANAGLPGAVTIATNMAGRGTDIKLGNGVRELGGLQIIGTERHESRRIDRQLRGRAGRQGDPGYSKFFISLEDDLMRLFGSERIARIMERLGLKEGEVIQHSMITKSIERAQKKVEENNFGIRKRLLEYDNVMNQQREVIYAKRRHALVGERLKDDIMEMTSDFVDELLELYYEKAEFENIQDELRVNFLVDFSLQPTQYQTLGKDGVKSEIMKSIVEFYERKEKNIGTETMAQIERISILQVIDMRWKEYLREVDDLKEGIHLRAYGQKDPILEYKGEAYKMFMELLQMVNREILNMVFKLFPSNTELQKNQRATRREQWKTTHSSSTGMGLQPQSQEKQEEPKVQQQIRAEEKVGRNDPCPCGSGKKYKQCHGK